MELSQVERSFERPWTDHPALLLMVLMVVMVLVVDDDGAEGVLLCRIYLPNIQSELAPPFLTSYLFS